MKVLAIDAGNSRIKWGLADADGWVRQSSLSTKDASELGAVVVTLARPERTVISNVAGEAVRANIASALAPIADRPRWVVARAFQCGVRSSYADPAQLGSDRWAALIGAWHLFHRGCAVVNVGTTLTVDALTGEGVFLGGIIVAGPDLMRSALARHTAQLRIEDGAFRYFPDTTADAIMSGAVNALAGSVERMVRFMSEAGASSPLIVLSGGGAGLIASRLNGAAEVVDNLVLEGLRRIGLENDAGA
jgi:type III pantothenate kinase